jgi:hypothetical protein
VSVGRSREELERLPRTRGATGFVAGWDDQHDAQMVMFRLADRMFRLRVPRADPADCARTPTGRARAVEDARRTAEAEERRRWRALLLVLEAPAGRARPATAPGRRSSPR